MGMVQSADYQDEYENYYHYVEDLENRSVNYTYNRTMTNKFTSVKQMEVVGIFIIEKAITKPHLSLKYAELATKLETEEVKLEDDEVEYFHFVLTEMFLGMLYKIVDMHSDEYIRDKVIRRGKDIAKFFGNLYNTGFFILTPIIEFGQKIKTKETPANAFFLREIFETMRDKLMIIHMTEAKLNLMIAIYDPNLTKDSDDEDWVISSDDDEELESYFVDKFANYLEDIMINESRVFEFYDEFKSCSDEIYTIQIKNLLDDCLDYQDKLNVYKDIALEIYTNCPERFSKVINIEVAELIKRYEIEQILSNKENWKRFSQLGRIVTTLFNAQLINLETTMKWFELAREKHAPITAFIMRFNEVKRKITGDDAKINWKHLMTISNVPIEAQNAMNELLKYDDEIGIKNHL